MSGSRLAVQCTARGGPNQEGNLTLHPKLSVILPTYRQAAFLSAAMRSVITQSFQDYELIVLQDGTDFDTAAVLASRVPDERVRIVVDPHNRGLGHTLNRGLREARGELVAYLASDDGWAERHLESAVNMLDADNDIYLVYSGLVSNAWRTGWRGKTLIGDVDVDATTADAPDRDEPFGFHSYNLLKLSQVVVRRQHESSLHWTERSEHVSDRLEGDYWRRLLSRGARFSYSGTVSCQWNSHPDQRHKIISDVRRPPLPTAPESGRGLSAYRQYYRVDAAVALDWRPTVGSWVKEHTAAKSLVHNPAVERPAVSRLLIAGDLGFNPDRLSAFTDAGVNLRGSWARDIEPWDTASSIPGVHVPAVEDTNASAVIRKFAPSAIYGLLNFQAVPHLFALTTEQPHIPFVFHFKESPQEAVRHGLWHQLVALTQRATGLVFINERTRQWFLDHVPSTADVPVLLLDGDMPSVRWFGQQRSEKLSSRDGRVHTACVGRPVGLDEERSLRSLARAGIHLHVYGAVSPRARSLWQALGAGTEDRRSPGSTVHLHDSVTPEQWTRELSRYDAAWLHVPSGPVDAVAGVADWNSLNLPARIGTYAAAGLPLLVVEPPGRPSATGDLVRGTKAGVIASDVDEIVERIGASGVLEQLAPIAWEKRMEYAFDTHVGDLLSFLSGPA